jgi:predicted nuclease with TOPRIM domain
MFNQLRLSTINQNLESEKRDLIVILDKRSQEISKLNEEWKLLNRKLSECEAKNCELTIRVETFENKESTIVVSAFCYQLKTLSQ